MSIEKTKSVKAERKLTMLGWLLHARCRFCSDKNGYMKFEPIFGRFLEHGNDFVTCEKCDSIFEIHW